MDVFTLGKQSGFCSVSKSALISNNGQEYTIRVEARSNIKIVDKVTNFNYDARSRLLCYMCVGDENLTILQLAAIDRICITANKKS